MRQDARVSSPELWSAADPLTHIDPLSGAGFFVADLHIHSHFSIATARDADLEHLDLWGRYKGVQVVGTGDCTHPQWLAEIAAKLEPALANVESPDFAAVARGFGVRGATARTLDEVAAGVDEFLKGDGPMVLDMRISRNVLNITYRRMFYGEDV